MTYSREQLLRISHCLYRCAYCEGKNESKSNSTLCCVRSALRNIWHEFLPNDLLPLVLSYLLEGIDKSFLLESQCSSSCVEILSCRVVRHGKEFFDLYLEMGEQAVPLMTAKRISKWTSFKVQYEFFFHELLLGKVSADSWGRKFSFLEKGRIYLEYLHPALFKVCVQLPKSDQLYQTQAYQMLMPGVVHPVMTFANGRPFQESSKNFRLMRLDDTQQQKTVLQFGKLSINQDDSYFMDVSDPLSILEAFCISLSIFEMDERVP